MVTGAERLSALDAAFLYLENDVQPLHLGSVLVLAGPAPTPQELRDHLATRLETVPWHRRRVRRMPADLGRPIWVDGGPLAVEEHLTHVVLEPPGDDAQLRELVGRVMTRRLDADRPLFHLWHVDGLADGRWALVATAHHAMVDGVSGADLVLSLTTAGPDAVLGAAPVPPGPPGRPSRPPPDPSTLGLVLPGAGWLVALPFRALRLLLRSLVAPRAAISAVRRVRHGLAQVVRPDLPPNVLGGPLSGERRWGWLCADAAEVAEVPESTGCTLNDVFLGAVAGGLRRYLLDRGEPLEATVVRVIVPVSGRTAGGPVRPGNLTSAMFLELPVHVADPLERLELVASLTAEQKSRAVAASTAALVRLADHVPAPLLARAARSYARDGQRRVNLAATDVVGPAHARRLAGRRLLEILPVTPLAQEVRVTVALVSYAGRLTIGVTVDGAALPDLDRLLDAIDGSLREVVGAVRRP
ncbi:MAG TPA: wax ester/triacylglycerol synthase family O-acyltransferase [Actinotalea sp.]|nr:wax ester/triacylglycerol synthase family O-acyltransferase [Actinotalea sp.]